MPEAHLGPARIVAPEGGHNFREVGGLTMRSDDAMTEVYLARRMEVFTGAGHRPTWSAEAKAQIVAESYRGLETVFAVARRHGSAALDELPREIKRWPASASAASFGVFAISQPLQRRRPETLGLPGGR